MKKLHLFMLAGATLISFHKANAQEIGCYNGSVISCVVDKDASLNCTTDPTRLCQVIESDPGCKPPCKYGYKCIKGKCTKSN